METFKLTGTTKTPHINLNATTGVLELSGRSIPEISSEFYAPVLDWVMEYAKAPKSKTVIEIKFEYFNTSSSKSILDFFKKVELIHKSGSSSVSVKWFVEKDDEAMEEAGQEYKSLVTLPFEILPC